MDFATNIATLFWVSSKVAAILLTLATTTHRPEYGRCERQATKTKTKKPTKTKTKQSKQAA
jgi:hypothetical protein